MEFKIKNINVFPSFWAMKFLYNIMDETDDVYILKAFEVGINELPSLLDPIFYLKGKNILNIFDDSD